MYPYIPTCVVHIVIMYVHNMLLPLIWTAGNILSLKYFVGDTIDPLKLITQNNFPQIIKEMKFKYSNSVNPLMNKGSNAE